MKRNLLVICCFLLSQATFAQKIINRPFYGSTTNSNLSIEQVELNDTATILRMKIVSSPDKWWSVSRNTYLSPDDKQKQLFVTHAQGISLGERMYTQNGVSFFTLFFPPLDTTVKKLDFIETDCDACFKIYNIFLSNEEFKSFSSNEEYMPVKSTLGTDNQNKPDSNCSEYKENQEKPQSSISYNGSSYNFMFSWKKKEYDPHWTGIGMAQASLNGLGSQADLSLSTSYSIVLNPIDYYVPISHNWLLVSGAGIDWTRYHFKGNKALEEVDGVTQFVTSPEGINYNSSKLLTYYLTLPLFLEYQTRISRKRDFFVSGGIVAYIKCYSKSQVEYNVEEGTRKEDKGRDLNILPVNARAMLQIGFGEVSVYGYYSPFSLFENGKGPDVKPIGIGLLLDF